MVIMLKMQHSEFHLRGFSIRFAFVVLIFNNTAAEKHARYNVLVTWWSRDTKVFFSAKKIFK